MHPDEGARDVAKDFRPGVARSGARCSHRSVSATIEYSGLGDAPGWEADALEDFLCTQSFAPGASNTASHRVTC